MIKVEPPAAQKFLEKGDKKSKDEPAGWLEIFGKGSLEILGVPFGSEFILYNIRAAGETTDLPG